MKLIIYDVVKLIYRPNAVCKNKYYVRVRINDMDLYFIILQTLNLSHNDPDESIFYCEDWEIGEVLWEKEFGLCLLNDDNYLSNDPDIHYCIGKLLKPLIRNYKIDKIC